MLPISSTDLLFLVFLAAYGVLYFTFVSNIWYLQRNRQKATTEDKPSVSILIPARNEAENLQRLLPSLLEQRYPKLEIIVYNDASTDETAGVLTSFASPRLTALHGNGPPPGWLGKVYALFQASRHATGEVFLFLDADTDLRDSGALARMISMYQNLPPKSVLTALPLYKSRGLALVSLLPFVLLTTLPWWLVRPIPFASLGMLNGQCWMIEASAYRRLEPHKMVANEVLEDVMIARYLKKNGITPALVNLKKELTVHMYSSFSEAWRGFRKNVYLLLSGHPVGFILLHSLFVFTFLFAPSTSIAFLAALFLLKALTDSTTGLLSWRTLLAPVGFLGAAILQWDSAWHHWTGRIAWKDRSVSP